MLSNLDFSIVGSDYTYARNKSNMVEILEKELAAIYGAKKCIITNSGMSAITTILNFLGKKISETILVNRNTYYETREFLRYSSYREVISVDMHDLKSVEKLLQKQSNVTVYLDNPDVFGAFYDVEALVEIVHQHNGILIVDNSMLSIFYENPLSRGADIVVESFTKYVCGHGDVLAGGIFFGKLFSDELCETFAKYVGRLGRYIPPMTLYLISRGFETLEVRLNRHTSSAQVMFKSLKKAGINALYAGKGGCIILPGFRQDFCERLKVFKMLPTFGTTYSTCGFVRNPDSYTVGDYVRLFVGLESPKILLQDVENALGIKLRCKHEAD